MKMQLMSRFQQLKKALVENKPILDCDFPDHTMEVEISDSDSNNEDEAHEDGKYYTTNFEFK